MAGTRPPARLSSVQRRASQLDCGKEQAPLQGRAAVAASLAPCLAVVGWCWARRRWCRPPSPADAPETPAPPHRGAAA